MNDGPDDFKKMRRQRNSLFAALREGTQWLEDLPAEVLQETDAAEVIEQVIAHNRAALAKASP